MESSILLSLILHVHIYIVVCPLKHILHKGGSDENNTEGLSGEKVELDSTCAQICLFENSVWRMRCDCIKLIHMVTVFEPMPQSMFPTGSEALKFIYPMHSFKCQYLPGYNKHSEMIDYGLFL